MKITKYIINAKFKGGNRVLCSSLDYKYIMATFKSLKKFYKPSFYKLQLFKEVTSRKLLIGR